MSDSKPGPGGEGHPADEVLARYARSLDPLYKDILLCFARVEPWRRQKYGLAVQTIHAALEGKYPISTIHRAAEVMADHGVLAFEQDIFVRPTALGEDIIAHLQPKMMTEDPFPEFPPPPTTGGR
jgi:hypothetical protein